MILPRRRHTLSDHYLMHGRLKHAARIYMLTLCIKPTPPPPPLDARGCCVAIRGCRTQPLFLPQGHHTTGGSCAADFRGTSARRGPPVISPMPVGPVTMAPVVRLGSPGGEGGAKDVIRSQCTILFGPPVQIVDMKYSHSLMRDR